jgi:hypothetical protein
LDTGGPRRQVILRQGYGTTSSAAVARALMDLKSVYDADM